MADKTKVMEQISKVLNSGSYERNVQSAQRIMNELNVGALSTDTIGIAMINEHRTLQQLFMRMVISYLKTLADSELYDMRNEATYKFAKSIRQQLEDTYLPYI